MATLDDLTALRTRVEKLRREADKASGALEQTLKKLREDFDCSSPEEAKEKLKQLQKEEQKIMDTFEKAMEQFEEDWPEE